MERILKFFFYTKLTQTQFFGPKYIIIITFFLFINLMKKVIFGFPTQRQIWTSELGWAIWIFDLKVEIDGLRTSKHVAVYQIGQWKLKKSVDQNLESRSKIFYLIFFHFWRHFPLVVSDLKKMSQYFVSGTTVCNSICIFVCLTNNDTSDVYDYELIWYFDQWNSY